MSTEPTRRPVCCDTELNPVEEGKEARGLKTAVGKGWHIVKYSFSLRGINCMSHGSASTLSELVMSEGQPRGWSKSQPAMGLGQEQTQQLPTLVFQERRVRPNSVLTPGAEGLGCRRAGRRAQNVRYGGYVGAGNYL